MRSLLGKLLALTMAAGGATACATATTATTDGSAPTQDRSISYAPHENGRPDPGEVCWAYVPYEDDPSQGKDRPVLIIGTDGGEWLALMLTSKDHDGNRAVKELPNGVAVDKYGHQWLDIGTGAWDSQGRPSEVRLDRILRLKNVRREGAALDQATFERVLNLAHLS